MKKTLVILILFGLILPSFTLSQAPVQIPETLEGAREMGVKAVKVTFENLPEIIGKIWKEEVLPIWQKMYNFAKTNIWDRYIWPWFQNIWRNVKSIFGQEVERRKPIIEEEFQKEKQELKEEAPQVGKSLWEKFKELIK